ncbi:MarR family winged helix-turn-helix transcriptional regulator [Azohydromonas australica]|uniref:MarR family winged helix-turn-helix transcriptional regulator n=1 Tax=Azohydromonas australica TaxID=364039 RepID=UPI000427975E|nr:MarR family transcriptional regulator [Azohydromonas australica]
MITDLLSSRLHSLAGLSAASASLRVERKFGLTLLEWRSIAMLGGFAPLSLKELARRTGMDKSYASRTLSSLIERKLVLSERSDTDARGVTLRLSEEGHALYETVFADALARNERLLSPLSAEQRKQLMDMLGALTVSAKRVLEEERQIAAGEAQDEDVAVPSGAKTAAKAAAGGVDMDEVRYLVSRLNELVGAG